MWRSKRLVEELAQALARLAPAGGALVRTARLAIGIPDYARYVEHVRHHHPDREPMSREVFYRERMQARYGRGRSRCC